MFFGRTFPGEEEEEDFLQPCIQPVKGNTYYLMFMRKSFLREALGNSFWLSSGRPPPFDPLTTDLEETRLIKTLLVFADMIYGIFLSSSINPN